MATRPNLTTGAMRLVLMEAIDDVRTGDLTEQKAGAIAKLAQQVNNSLLAEIEIMRADIMGKADGKMIGGLALGDDEQPQTRVINHKGGE